MIVEQDLPVGIDVDECVADLLAGCCEFRNETFWPKYVRNLGDYNRALYAVQGKAKLVGEPPKRPYPDKLLPEDLRGWDLKPYFGEGWQRWLATPEFYKKYVRPMQGARLGVERLRKAGHRVVFVSACVPGSTNQKQQWLVDWGFLDASNVEQDFWAIKDKKLLRLKALFDDGIHNVEGAPYPTFLVNHWHNSEEICSRPRVQGVYYALDTLRDHGLANW